MVSLLVAQLAGAYNATFEDMLGWARLKRGEVCVASMGSVPRARWDRFVASLRLEAPLEGGGGSYCGISITPRRRIPAVGIRSRPDRHSVVGLGVWLGPFPGHSCAGGRRCGSTCF